MSGSKGDIRVAEASREAELLSLSIRKQSEATLVLEDQPRVSHQQLHQLSQPMEQRHMSEKISRTAYKDRKSSYPSSRCRSYATYVEALCSRNPSLMNLYQFLTEPKTSKPCRMCAIDFIPGRDLPVIRDHLDTSELSVEIDLKDPARRDTVLDSNQQSQNHSSREKQLEGRILVIEDLSAEIVELLGATLDIDPLFFALHLHTVHRTGSRHQTPDEAALPSRLLSEDFANISYHRAVTSDTEVPLRGKFLRRTTINRKLVFLRGTRVALAQHCASVIRIKKARGPWLALILVDPPIGNIYTSDDISQQSVALHLRPFMGTYEDFVKPAPFSTFDEDGDCETPYSEAAHVDHGMFEDLKRYWSQATPACFNPKDPSIQSLAYYTLSITAGEWVKYVAVMQYCLKQYEYNHDQLPGLSLDKFDKDLRELQSWRRRTIISIGKIQAVLRFLSLKFVERSFDSHSKHKELAMLSYDFEYIEKNIENVGRRLESMLPVVMSFVQITDARRSFAETANITRLTVLALVFVPLTFVSSLFSMNTELLPGMGVFWLYFVIAIPVTTLVVLVARPPVAFLKKTLPSLFGGDHSALVRRGLERSKTVNLERSQTVLETRV